MTTRLALFAVACAASATGTFAQNDDCAGALPLPLDTPTLFDTTAASVGGPAWPCAGGGAPDLWYVVTPNSASSILRIETCGSSYDTALEVFQGGCSAPVSVLCNDDACQLQSIAQLQVTSTAPVLVRVGGFNGSTGQGTILATETIPAPVTVTDSLSGVFMDISATGTPLSLNDDDEVDVQTTVGNAVLAAGTVRVGSNGGVRFDGTGLSLTAGNGTLPSSGAFGGDMTLLPFWDDVDTNGGLEGEIYWQEIGNVLIFQWEDVEFFPGGTGGVDIATFQIQVFGGGGPVIAQFLYQDIEGLRPDGGAGATIGFQGGLSGSVTDATYSVDVAASVANGDVLSFVTNGGTIGMPYCTGVSNSTGVTGRMSATGSTVVANNSVTLIATELPQNSFGMFIASRTAGFIAGPNGSLGNLCLSGGIGRFVAPGQVQNTRNAGELILPIDLSLMPQPAGMVSTSVGDTWNFQLWHRDSVGGVAVSNFTEALEVSF